MGFRIEDGTGRGRTAKVNELNRLEVSAVTLTEISDIARSGGAFSVVARHTIQADSTEENLLYIKNNNDAKCIHLHSIRLAAKVTAAGLLVISYFDPVRVSGGTEKEAVQLNRQKAKAADADLYDNSSNDLSLTLTAAKEFAEFRLGATGTAFFESDGALVLGPGDTFGMTAEGIDGDLVTASIFFFEAEESK